MTLDPNALRRHLARESAERMERECQERAASSPPLRPTTAPLPVEAEKTPERRKRVQRGAGAPTRRSTSIKK